jgi:quercetin dioxygenase-like cupin family protein
MSEMRPNTPQDCRPTGAVEITVHTLEPNQRLALPPCEHAVLVTEGLLYVVLDDDELALIAGEEVVIPSGQLQFAYNAGSDVARIAALRR